MDRVQIVHDNFLRRTASRDLPQGLPPAGPLSGAEAVAIYRSGCLSRSLDRVSRTLQARGEGFYTIGSSGHENNAAVAAALRADDMAFLHYRSNAFQIHRSKQVDGQTPAWDMLLSFAASAEDPISGGRHKVIGSKPLSIPPQTSTIASHLPKAVGAAFSIGIARMLKLDDTPLADGFDRPRQLRRRLGQSFDRAGRVQHRRLGRLSGRRRCRSSVPVRGQWHRHFDADAGRLDRGPVPAIGRACITVHCSGLDMVDAYRGARVAAHHARTKRKPVFLHMDTVRLYGHAGSDMQATYLSKAQIEADEEARSPAVQRLPAGRAGPARPEADSRHLQCDRSRSRRGSPSRRSRRPKLTTSKAVMASLIPPPRAAPADANRPSPEEREAMFGARRRG